MAATRKPKARGNGEGSVYQDATGQWWAQITLNGRAVRRRAKTQKIALAKLKDLQTQRTDGVRLDQEQPTLGDWCITWLDHYTPTLKANIRADYRGVVRRYIEDAENKYGRIGRKRLRELTPSTIQAWLNTLGKHVSAQTVRNAHARLRKALAVALRHGYVARNVAVGVELPATEDHTMQPLNFSQARALLHKTHGHRWAVAYRLAINLGLRQAELLGLTWDCIDLQAGTIRITQQLKRVPKKDGSGNEFNLQSVKTKSGNRVLLINEELCADMRAHRKNQAEERLLSGPNWRDPYTKRGGLVFVSETGAPIHASNMVSHFKDSLKQAELPIIRFHDLRHTCATLLLSENVPLVTVSKILGHSSPAVTAKIYAHALDEQKAEAISGLSKKLRRA